MRTAVRWAIPATVAATVVGGSLLWPSLAGAAPDLAATTAEELLADVAAAEPRAFSGTVVQTTDLGLPELPAAFGSDDDPAGLTGLLAGTTTAKVWSDGAERNRIAVIGTLAETDVVQDGADVWTWRSGTGTVVHSVLPAGPEHAGAPAGTQLTPAEAAQQVLAALEPSTAVGLDGTVTVAGRAAHQLVLAPRDAATLVGRVVVAVDAETAAPLRVQVFPRGDAEPAVETGFTSVSFTTPSADELSPALPQDAVVEEVDAGPADLRTQLADPVDRPVVIGSGWTSVAVLRTDGPALDGADAEVGSLLEAASRPVSGAYGTGRLVTSSLVSALLLDDGRVLVGAVAAPELERAALDPAARR
jgi:hypothetical protein